MIRLQNRTILPFGLIVFASLGAFSSQEASAESKSLETLKAETEKIFSEKVAPFVKSYCGDCHGQRRQRGGINFLPALSSPGKPMSSRLWKKALANVSAHDMPPEDSDQPSENERQQFLTWVNQLKYLSPEDPGPFVIRRLTKAEYGNTLKDLLGVDPSVASELPDEVPGEGYLNSLSPMQSEQYLEIANKVLDQVLSPNGKSTTITQKRFFGDAPKSPADARASARKVATEFARRAYRRPASDPEIEVLMSVFDLASENKLAYSDALRLMLKAVLVSPQFLFITPAQKAPDNQSIVPLDDHQLASRLSYFLWGTMPDSTLSTLADQGKLHEPNILKAQVVRMLTDKRARALFDGFGAQWLAVGEIKTKTFDPKKFPLMTPEMRQAMYDEARLFFEDSIRQNHSVVRLIDSKSTFLNDTLAKLYGMEKTVTGPEMRQVKLNNPNRGGFLGMPSVLATTSFPNRTSPVKRGVWVLEQILGEHIPPPPANVPLLEEQDAKDISNLTLRERNELHQVNATCANCHKILDPIGFGLENFDAIGRWREQDDKGGAIDASGQLPSGQTFSSPRELKTIIAARKDDLARNLTRKLLAYALCRQLEGYDEIVVDQLMEPIAKADYRLQTIITQVVTSYPFLNRRIK